MEKITKRELVALHIKNTLCDLLNELEVTVPPNIKGNVILNDYSLSIYDSVTSICKNLNID